MGKKIFFNKSQMFKYATLAALAATTNAHKLTEADYKKIKSFLSVEVSEQDVREWHEEVEELKHDAEAHMAGRVTNHRNTVENRIFFINYHARALVANKESRDLM